MIGLVIRGARARARSAAALAIASDGDGVPHRSAWCATA